MAQEVTIGGERLGSGNKVQVELHDYKMNSFNQSQIFRSSLAPGLLYPFCRLVGTNHGTFDIDLSTIVRTLPTQGPLFGSFKLQIDLFSVPFRLYQGILHNNPVELGLNMNKVYLPKIIIGTQEGSDAPRVLGSNDDNRQINDNSLMKYLGLSGIGTNPTIEENEEGSRSDTVQRKINAIPVLAYYDIFKCYYSNKQEEDAYVITPGTVEEGKTALRGIWIEKGEFNYYEIPYSGNEINIQKFDTEPQQVKVVLYYYVPKQNVEFELTETIKQDIRQNQLLTINYADDEEHTRSFEEVSINSIKTTYGIVQAEEWRVNQDPSQEVEANPGYTIEYTLYLKI